MKISQKRLKEIINEELEQLLDVDEDKRLNEELSRLDEEFTRQLNELDMSGILKKAGGFARSAGQFGAQSIQKVMNVFMQTLKKATPLLRRKVLSDMLAQMVNLEELTALVSEVKRKMGEAAAETAETAESPLPRTHDTPDPAAAPPPVKGA